MRIVILLLALVAVASAATRRVSRDGDDYDGAAYTQREMGGDDSSEWLEDATGTQRSKTDDITTPQVTQLDISAPAPTPVPPPPQAAKHVRYYAEFLGTFVFLSGILTCAGGETGTLKLSMALALAAYMIGGVSGGHMNPAVTSMLLIKGGGDVNAMDSCIYALVQILGGITAAVVNQILTPAPAKAADIKDGAEESLLDKAKADTKEPDLVKSVLAEIIGTAIFFTGILSSGGKPLVVGLSLWIAANIIGSVSGGHMNPAVTIMMLFKKEVGNSYRTCALNRSLNSDTPTSEPSPIIYNI